MVDGFHHEDKPRRFYPSKKTSCVSEWKTNRPLFGIILDGLCVAMVNFQTFLLPRIREMIFARAGQIQKKREATLKNGVPRVLHFGGIFSARVRWHLLNREGPTRVNQPLQHMQVRILGTQNVWYQAGIYTGGCRAIAPSRRKTLNLNTLQKETVLHNLKQAS